MLSISSRSLQAMTKPVCLIHCISWASFSLTHSLTRSLTHSLTQSLPHTVKCFYKKEWKKRTLLAFHMIFSSFHLSYKIKMKGYAFYVVFTSHIHLFAWRLKWRLFVEEKKRRRAGAAGEQTKGREEELTEASSLSHHSFQLEIHLKVQAVSKQIILHGQERSVQFNWRSESLSLAIIFAFLLLYQWSIC